MRKTKEAITPAEYQAFQEAYDFFNTELFGGSLPHVLVTLLRHAKARGYFSPERFTGRVERAALRFAARKRDPRSRWIEAVRERHWLIGTRVCCGRCSRATKITVSRPLPERRAGKSLPKGGCEDCLPS